MVDDSDSVTHVLADATDVDFGDDGVIDFNFNHPFISI